MTAVRWGWGALVLAACLLRFVWIADIFFANDEPQLFFHAIEANAQGGWATHGLLGSRGLDYGPLPIWMYQVGLKLTTDPRQIALLKAGVMTVVTAACLYVLGNLFGRGAGALVWVWFLSPSLWALSRDLWDVSWAVPLALVAWTAYLKFDTAPRLGTLAVVLVGMHGLALTHLISASLLIAIAAHGCWMHRSWLWRRRWGVLALLVVTGLPSIRYVHHLWSSRGAAAGGNWSVWSGLENVLLYKPFVGVGLEAALGEEWWKYPGFSPVATATLGVLRWVSFAGAFFFLCGVVLAARNLVRRVGPQQENERVIATADRLALAVVVLHGLLAAAEGLEPLLQYFNVLAPVGLYLVWRGARFLAGLAVERPPSTVLVGGARCLLGAWVISLLSLLIGLQWRLHDGHGTRPYGPTLGNQWEIAQQLVRFPDDVRVTSTAVHPNVFPYALGALRALARLRLAEAGSAVAPAPPPGRPEISYRAPANRWDGEMVLTIQPAPSSPSVGR